MKIISSQGSVQNIDSIPKNIRDLYKTVWEISQKTIVQMAVDRGAYIDQSQSLNIHFAEPNITKLTSMHFFGWRSGLKTGMYYLRTKPAAQAIQFTVDKTKIRITEEIQEPNDVNDGNNDKNSGDFTMNKTREERELALAKLECSLANKDACLLCSS